MSRIVRKPARQSAAVPLPVPPDRRPRAVRGSPVELHHEARSRPYEIDLVALDPDVGLRLLDPHRSRNIRKRSSSGDRVLCRARVGRLQHRSARAAPGWLQLRH